MNYELPEVLQAVLRQEKQESNILYVSRGKNLFETCRVYVDNGGTLRVYAYEREMACPVSRIDLPWVELDNARAEKESNKRDILQSLRLIENEMDFENPQMDRVVEWAQAIADKAKKGE